MFEQKEYTRIETTLALLRGCINSMAETDDKNEVYELYVYAQRLLYDLVEAKIDRYGNYENYKKEC